MIGLAGLIGNASAAQHEIHDCAIKARVSLPGGILNKFYKCREGAVKISGKWSVGPDIMGRIARQELGTFWFGETADIKPVPASIVKAFTACEWDGSGGNTEGYMTESVNFKCAEGSLKMHGAWGEEYQGNWSYRTEFGECCSTEPEWEESPLENVVFSRHFQKWERTELGWRLVGSIDEPRVNHGKPPVFKRLPKPIKGKITFNGEGAYGTGPSIGQTSDDK